jgi:hypothetical protein
MRAAMASSNDGGITPLLRVLYREFFRLCAPFEHLGGVEEPGDR